MWQGLFVFPHLSLILLLFCFGGNERTDNKSIMATFNLLYFNLYCLFLNTESSSSTSSFHFLPEGSRNGGGINCNGSSNGLCHDVPTMLGLNNNNTVTVRSGNAISPAGGRTSNGFYKRMLEWISRKKKSHRRYSEVVTDRHLMAVSSSCRNQSAPMIFNIQQHPDLVRHPTHKSTTQLDQQECQPGGGSLTHPGGRKLTHSPGAYLSVVDESLLQRLQRLSSSSSANSEDRPLTPTPSTLSQSIEKQESEDRVDAEWIIPWNDIEVGQVVSHRGSCTINR